MAYPVAPPNPKPMHRTSKPTGNASKAPRLLVGAEASNAPKTSTNVAMTSVVKLESVCGMAGAVENTANLRLASSVAAKC